MNAYRWIITYWRPGSRAPIETELIGTIHDLSAFICELGEWAEIAVLRLLAPARSPFPRREIDSEAGPEERSPAVSGTEAEHE